MAQRHTPISRGMNRFLLAAMAAKGTIEVCAANGSQASPRSRRRFASIDTVPATATMAQVASRHEPSEPDYRSHREGAPIAVFAQYPDRTVAHRSAGDAKMNTGEEERTQDQ